MAKTVNPVKEADNTGILQVRKGLSDMIKILENETSRRGVDGAELTLAMRHLQDARMRLGVALTMRKGQYPWAN